MSHLLRSHADAAEPSAETSLPAQAGNGLSQWERERIRRRAFDMWREDGFPVTRRHEHWGIAQLQMLKSYPAS